MLFKVKDSLSLTVGTVCLLVSIITFTHLILPDLHGPSVPAGLAFLALCGPPAIIVLSHALVRWPRGLSCTPKAWREARDLAHHGIVRFLHARDPEDRSPAYCLVCLQTRTHCEFTLAVPTSHPDYPLLLNLRNGDNVKSLLNIDSRKGHCERPADLLRFQKA
jgi:hypothetical protein